jgi:hypothetical protein
MEIYRLHAPAVLALRKEIFAEWRMDPLQSQVMYVDVAM